MEWGLYSAKHKTHTLKYEVGFSFGHQHVILVNGPFKGSVHDLTITKYQMVSLMEVNEKAQGDLGYQGNTKFLVPFKPPRNRAGKNYNFHHYRICQSIERCNKRYKHFNIIKGVFRGHDYPLYHSIFLFVVILPILI